MAGERIPALATHLCSVVSGPVAEVVALHREHDPEELASRAFQAARQGLDPRLMKVILGQFDSWSMEAALTAGELSTAALHAALEDHRLWDRRKTKKTIQRLLWELMGAHIGHWSRERGMDTDVIARLANGGDE